MDEDTYEFEFVTIAGRAVFVEQGEHGWGAWVEELAIFAAGATRGEVLRLIAEALEERT